MDGLGLHPGGLGHTLGRTTRRRAKEQLHRFGSQNAQDRVHDGGLANAWTTGNHHELRAQCQPDRIGLACRKSEARLLLDPWQGLVCVDLRPRQGARADALHVLGDPAFGKIKPGQEDAVRIAHAIGCHSLFRQFLLQRALDQRGRDLGQQGLDPVALVRIVERIRPAQMLTGPVV